ncbi:MAG: aminoacyl-histidine dipeptidase [Faecalibacterium sp.]|jgi:dipeptidase D|nr:aminoacyl-histidine dipeptidase [Faecalibacterium sp.]
MRVLENLEPKAVFSFFEDLCAIPHGSTHTKAISDYCVAFAKARGLEYYQDDANNIILKKPATAGYEAAAPVILQGHLDMVCDKAPDCTKDMETEGLELAIDTEKNEVYAKGTTLGGDDGIAVAMALAILDAADLPHPALEAVFTTDEEIGMLGAMALDASPLKGRILINIDSEDEGVFTVSCAGGNMSKCCLPIAREHFSGTRYTLSIHGCLGGHSGQEINKGRLNPCMALGRILYTLGQKTSFRLISVAGGTKDNAIPTNATAELIAKDGAAVAAVAAEYGRRFAVEFATADPDIAVEAAAAGDANADTMDKETTRKVVCMLTALPNGVQAMSADMPGLVQTSLNLGILKTTEARVEANFCVRSALDSQKEMLKDRLACLMGALGGSVEYSGDYPGWAYKKDSILRERMVEVYKDQYGAEPKVEAIHAGVECGLFAGKLAGLDAVSFGPNLRQIHTFRERMEIGSVQRTWKFLCEVLRRMH